MNDVERRAAEIVKDARRRLNVEKGHELCTEECSCSPAIRIVEDHLIQCEEELSKS